MNPFDQFKAKEGEKTLGELSFIETNSTKEFRDTYYQWVDEVGLYAFDNDEEIEHLLEMIVIYKFWKDFNTDINIRNKKLSARIKAGKIKDVTATAKNQAYKLLSILGGGNPAIIATVKGRELAALLSDLIDDPEAYITDKMTRLPANRDNIDKFLNSKFFPKEAKEALYTIL